MWPEIVVFVVVMGIGAIASALSKSFKNDAKAATKEPPKPSWDPNLVNKKKTQDKVFAEKTPQKPVTSSIHKSTMAPRVTATLHNHLDCVKERNERGFNYEDEIIEDSDTTIEVSDEDVAKAIILGDVINTPAFKRHLK